MFRQLRNSKLIWSSVFLILASGIAGCGTADKRDYKFQPTFIDRSVARTLAPNYKDEEFVVNGMKVKVEKGKDDKTHNIRFVDYDVSIPFDSIQVSDADVLGFSGDIQKALRRRMDRARRVRLGSGSAQVLAAATGATLGLLTRDVATAAIFAGISAVMPELQHIFQARERSEAYAQGLELIQDADARYYNKRTESAGPKGLSEVSNNTLTKEGAELLSEIAACIKLVDKALIQTIPTIEDLQAATGRLEEKLGAIKLVPQDPHIPVEGTQTIHATNSNVTTYAVDQSNIIKLDDATIKAIESNVGTTDIKFTGVAPGNVTLTVYNRLGHKGSCKVTVEGGTSTTGTSGTSTTNQASSPAALPVGESAP